MEGLDDKVALALYSCCRVSLMPSKRAVASPAPPFQATFRNPLRKGRRCVVFADGFFEWATTKEGKQPYYLYMRGSGNAERNAGD